MEKREKKSNILQHSWTVMDYLLGNDLNKKKSEKKKKDFFFFL